MITMDKDGNIWEAMMGQAQIRQARPEDGKGLHLPGARLEKGRHAVHHDRRPAFER